MSTWNAASSLTASDPIPPRPLAEPVAALDFWDSLFVRAMDSSKIKYPQEPKALAQSAYSIRNKKDWSSIFEQLDTAKNEYSNVDKGFKGGSRKVYRRLAEDVAQPLIGAAKFVPDVDYVTPVLGAVQVLLEAAKRAAKIREEILIGFDDIDMMFSQIEIFIEVFPGDKNIEKASIDLIVATFYAIECVIGFFVKRFWKRGMSAIFTGTEYQANVTKSLQAVKSQSQSLIDQANKSQVRGMSWAMKRILNVTASWNLSLQQIYRVQVMGQQESRNSRNLIYRLIRECQSQRSAMKRLGDLLEETIDHRLSSPAPPEHSIINEKQIDPQYLLDWIGIPDLASQDLGQIEEKTQTRVPAHERARAEQLILVGQVQEWLRCPRSSHLLVHGNYDSRRHISGLSLFCASLIQSVAEGYPHFLHITFFCGLHTDANMDKHTGGLAMIQSFICQLLCQFDFSGRLPANVVARELEQWGDIEELCRLFTWLVQQLPSHVVLVCLIDGILYYERKEFLEGMGHVLVTILEISSEQRTQAAVKVLVTSPTRTTEARKPFPDELIVSMDAMAPPRTVASKWRLARQLREEMKDQLAE